MRFLLLGSNQYSQNSVTLIKLQTLIGSTAIAYYCYCCFAFASSSISLSSVLIISFENSLTNFSAYQPGK